ncbi:DUF305 domain-containing protein [Candidatus Gottesmanbacteria bacterium RBG_13_37_7]|uniref:DUF305 domain-containing protein n=1 Tax=Candidatus Gottesmanbacteria bacterium RBG_13_37_7 TaxID=1798369 RepID=A0A1F5YIG1_9BACT|nr:MAG: DUF305 domain-containing protein [Candidatus Gottesmanbacteria bacterium RBG_13_37_7]
MKKISLSLSISFMIVALLVGLAAGYYISPSYQQTMYNKEEMGFGQADRFVDLRYINQMATHHKGAILLANQIGNKSQRVEIKNLIAEIQTSEPKLIDELYAWKKQWYNDNRVIKDPIVPNLGDLDEKTDLRFLNALIAHHEEGIKMTKEIKVKSSRKEILNNADTVEQFLTKSLVTLKGWREEWYEVK